MPRLHACYGPAPTRSGHWMDLQARWLHAYAAMRPRIEAERALALVSQIAAGNGLMAKADQREYIDGLRRTMHGGRLPRASAASIASLAQIGIKVETEPMSPGGVLLPRGVDLTDAT